MKRLFLYMMAGVLALPAFWSCNDAENPALSNSIYLVDAIERDDFDCIIKPMRDNTYNIVVKMTHKLDHDVKLKMIVDQDLLDKHYEEFGEQIPLLPAENWILYDTDGTPHAGESMELTIPANSTTAVLPVKIFALENGDANQYALPLTIAGVSDDILVLEKMRSLLFVFDSPFTTYGLNLTRNSPSFYAYLKEDLTCHNWTVEFHVHYQRTTADASVGSVTFMTNPDFLYVRPYLTSNAYDIHLNADYGCGTGGSVDKSGLPSDYLSNSIYNGEWLHFAFVCENGSVTSYLNGSSQGTANNPDYDKNYTFSSFTFSTASKQGTMAFTEFRFWSVARTQAQLSRFKYDVSTSTKGLEVYYKMNDPESTVLVDLMGRGNDIDLTDRFSSGTANWLQIKSNDDFTSFVSVQ